MRTVNLSARFLRILFDGDVSVTCNLVVRVILTMLLPSPRKTYADLYILNVDL